MSGAGLLLDGSGLRRLGLAIVAAMLVTAAVGPLLAPYAPGDWVGAPFAAPSRAHWLGTDDMGQDLWSAWLFGARHSVAIALLVALGATAVGTLLGASAINRADSFGNIDGVGVEGTGGGFEFAVAAGQCGARSRGRQENMLAKQ